MAYIGNAKTPLLYASNVRDDIVPDGVASSFTLSQEVPGGYENNIVVIRRKYLLEDLLIGAVVDFDTAADKLIISSGSASAVASLLQPPIPNVYPGDNVVISGATNPANNGTFPVLAVTFDGTNCEVFIDGNLVDEIGSTITLVRGRIGPWEILEGETEYTIGGAGPDYNKIITFSEVPQEDDTLYVLHRGDATYNFVPTTASVGPEQLQQNLRNFVADRFTGDGVEDTYALSQFAVNSKTLLVTVDGEHLDGDDPDQSFVGEWELALDGLSITFHTPPANLSKIKILHLGFSTVTRRAALSPGQVGAIAPNSITSTQLAPNSVTSSELDASSVTNSKIAAGAVDGTKILLKNQLVDGDGLRGKRFDSVPTYLLYINGANETVLLSDADMPFVRTGSGVKMRLDASQLRPELAAGIGLGTLAIPWAHIFVQGTSKLGATEIDSLLCNNNATINGNITVTGTIDNVDVSDLQADVAALQATVSALLVPGTMIMWMKDAAAPAGWLLCQGQEVSQITYAALFAEIGTTFNTGGESPGNFRVPNMRQRFPLGKASSGTGSGWGGLLGVGGTIDHSHTGGVHTHDISSHTHNLPAHHHALGSGADLSINSSGIHTTSITHDHGAFDTASSGAHEHTIQGTITTEASTHHQHSGNTGYVNLAHRHRSWDGSSWNGLVSTSNPFGFNNQIGNPDTMPVVHVSGGNHTHNVNSSENGADGGTRFIIRQAAPGYTQTAGGHNIIDVNSGHHSHATGIWPWVTAANDADLNHRHPFTSDAGQGGHGHNINGQTTLYAHTNNGSRNSAHVHNIDIPNFSGNSTSDGSHTHTTSNFSGRIGLVTGGVDGNSTMVSAASNTANTGSSGAVATTSNNPPFQTVHYIIKT